MDCHQRTITVRRNLQFSRTRQGQNQWFNCQERDDQIQIAQPRLGQGTFQSNKFKIGEIQIISFILQVWRLADVDQDGALDADEFALAMHLINIKLEGYDLPEDLPDHLVPPTKRRMMNGLAAKKDSF